MRSCAAAVENFIGQRLAAEAHAVCSQKIGRTAAHGEAVDIARLAENEHRRGGLSDNQVINLRTGQKIRLFLENFQRGRKTAAIADGGNPVLLCKGQRCLAGACA